MSISYVQNGDSGLVARTLINQAIDGVNSGSFPYTGSAKITGSLSVTGSTTSTLGFTGSLQGTATSASYVLNAVSASNAITASYVLQAVSSSFASTASYVVTAQTASYVLNAVSASFATTASFALNGGTSFPYTGSAIISGSLQITGSLKLNEGGITGAGTGVMFIDSNNIVSNIPEFTAIGNVITGGSRGTMNLSNLGVSSAANGLRIPTTIPSAPNTGSMYVDFGASKLYLYNGTVWVSSSLG